MITILLILLHIQVLPRKEPPLKASSLQQEHQTCVRWGFFFLCVCFLTHVLGTPKSHWTFPKAMHLVNIVSLNTGSWFSIHVNDL